MKLPSALLLTIAPPVLATGCAVTTDDGEVTETIGRVQENLVANDELDVYCGNPQMGTPEANEYVQKLCLNVFGPCWQSKYLPLIAYKQLNVDTIGTRWFFIAMGRTNDVYNVGTEWIPANFGDVCLPPFTSRPWQWINGGAGLWHLDCENHYWDGTLLANLYALNANSQECTDMKNLDRWSRTKLAYAAVNPPVPLNTSCNNLVIFDPNEPATGTCYTC